MYCPCLKLFVGFDERNPAAIHTFVHSVMTKLKPISFTFPARNQPFTDPSQKEDYPQSNAFIFSRFLVPHLCDFKGWALFAMAICCAWMIFPNYLI